MDNKNPDDWYDNLRDRESNPGGDDPVNRDHGFGERAGERAGEYAAEGAKKAGKKSVEKFGKEGAKKAGGELAKQGAKQAASKGAVTAAGVAGAAPTAGASLALAAASQLVTSKKGRKILIACLALPLILFIVILPVIGVLVPMMVKEGLSNVAMSVVKHVPIVRGAMIVSNGVGYVADKAASAAEKVGDIADEGITILGEGVSDAIDIVDDIGNPFGGVEFHDTAKTLALEDTPAVDSSGAAVLGIAAGDAAGTPLDENSRLATLYKAMQREGYFQKVLEKNRVSVVYLKNKHFRILLKGEKVAEVDSASKIAKAFQDNKKLRDIITKSMQDDLKVWNYSQRVTLAEKGKENYETEKLYLPGADVATKGEDIADVKKNSKQLVNRESVEELNGSLKCVYRDCGTWVPTTVDSDDKELAESITQNSGFKSKGSLDSLMRKRFREAKKDGDLNLLEMFNYVAELRDAAKLTDETAIQNNTFIQGIAKTRKDQSARLWFHTQTMIDQFTANQMTSVTAAALFKDLNGIGSSKAYKIITGSTGGKEFKEYEKINDNQPNIATKIYDSWKEKNPYYAVLVDKIADLWSAVSSIPFVSFDGILDYLTNHGFEDIPAAIESAYDFASQATIPACDSNKTGERLLNCMFAGAQVTARDVGISDYGLNGDISEQDRQEMLSYVNETESRIASTRPLSERLFSTQTSTSFLGTFLLRAELPFDIASNPASLLGYIASAPQRLLADIRSPLTSKVIADDDMSSVNNIKNAGIKLSSLKDTPLSITLNSSTGGLESCPTTTENQENTCRSDETTYKALAAKFDVEDALTDGFTGNSQLNLRIATYNLWGDTHSGPDVNDSDRFNRQMDLIRNNQIGVVGLQEVHTTQYRRLKERVTDYGIYPETAIYGNDRTSADTIIWNKSLYTKITAGTRNHLYKEGGIRKHPFVLLQDKTTKQKFFVINTHDPSEEEHADQRFANANDYVDHLKEFNSKGYPVFMTGDFNSGYWVRPNGGGSNDGNTTYLGERKNLTYCILTRDGTMWDAYDSLLGRSGECPTHEGNQPGQEECSPNEQSCNNRPGNSVDHIFMSKEVKTTRFWHIKSNNNGSDVHDTVIADTKYGESEGGGQGGWVFPVAKGNWTGSFGWNVWGYRWADGRHQGIDISGSASKPALAAHGGVVESVNDGGSCKTYVIIKATGTPYWIAYQHLKPGSIKVERGDKVDSKQVIGLIDPVGPVRDCGSGAHLHFSIEKGNHISSYSDGLGKSDSAMPTVPPLCLLPRDGYNFGNAYDADLCRRLGL